MFERFTERARQVIVLAQEEARKAYVNYIGTEHILLGLIREEEGLAARTLESFGNVTLEAVRERVEESYDPDRERVIVEGKIPFTPRAKKILEMALREALSLGHNYIGTEHILLGLVRENEGLAARILIEMDAEPHDIREEIIRMLSGSRERTETPAGLANEMSELGGKPEKKWYIDFQVGEIYHSHQGGWDNKPIAKLLDNGIMRFTDPSFGDHTEVLIPANNLITARIYCDAPTAKAQ